MRGISKEHLQLSNDSIHTSDTSTSSSPRQIPDKKYPSYIKEVYDYNFVEELGVISELIDEYNYIGMDTEFPGTVYCVKNIKSDFYYKTLKMNVDSLKLIQLGITLTNENGEYPKNIPYHTWQFNFDFDINEDEYNEQSINLLKKSGIDFATLKKKGIKKNTFAANLITSGLVLNSDVYWISYHGSYDFGYILSLLTNESLPKDEEEFIKILSIYFPNFYDIKMLVKDLYYLDGGLNRIINKLGVTRKGIMHQAGSDSIATIESFLALINLHIINDAKIIKFKNSLYGIGIGRDNENTINYTKVNNNTNVVNSRNNCEEIKERNKGAFNMKQSQINNFNINNNNSCTNNNNISNNTNNNNNTNFNWFCPFMFFGNYGMMQNCNCSAFMNNTNNNCMNCLLNCNEIMA